MYSIYLEVDSRIVFEKYYGYILGLVVIRKFLFSKTEVNKNQNKTDRNTRTMNKNQKNNIRKNN